MKKILIVDDDRRHLHATRDLLRIDGYEVLTQEEPLGTTRVVMSERPDLVLLDINMPALSGERLAAILSANRLTRGTRVVFYSSNDEDSLRQSVSRHRVAGYICKGSVPELRRKVAEYLNPDLSPELGYNVR
jgi:CheY-like chemotaxis protein